MPSKSKITKFFVSQGYGHSEAAGWQHKPNGQQMLRLHDAVVNVYETGTVLWQGKKGSEHKRCFADWIPGVEEVKDTSASAGLPESGEIVAESGAVQPEASVVLRGQKSTLHGGHWWSATLS